MPSREFCKHRLGPKDPSTASLMECGEFEDDFVALQGSYDGIFPVLGLNYFSSLQHQDQLITLI